MGRVPLNLTKVAFAIETVEQLAERMAARHAAGEALTTRYLPKRVAELEGGSLFWILKHRLIARSPILGFGEAEGGRAAIHLGPQLILVESRPKRAHQGWRYLEHTDAPADLVGEGSGAEAMPPRLIGELSALGLL